MAEKLLALVVLALALLLAGLAFFWDPAPADRPLPETGLPPGGDFVLQSASGPVALQDYRGKVVVLDFGYTACPDICPTSLAAVADAMEQLEPAEKEKLAVLFVSLDPQRDTPERLKQYTAFFNPGFVGISGKDEEVAEVARRYGVVYQRQAVATAAGGYVLDHSADLYVLARDGRVAERIAHGTAPLQIARSIRQAMARW